MEITEQQTQLAYLIGQQVVSRQLTLREAKIKLAEQSGMNAGSASNMIYGLYGMMLGNDYKRTLNFQTTQYFLQSIHRDHGPNKLRFALNIVRRHLDYYKGVGRSNQPAIRRLVEELSQKVISKTTLKEYQDEFQNAVSQSSANPAD